MHAALRTNPNGLREDEAHTQKTVTRFSGMLSTRDISSCATPPPPRPVFGIMAPSSSTSRTARQRSVPHRQRRCRIAVGARYANMWLNDSLFETSCGHSKSWLSCVVRMVAVDVHGFSVAHNSRHYNCRVPSRRPGNARYVHTTLCIAQQSGVSKVPPSIQTGAA